MKAALVREAGQTPVYGDFAAPIPAAGEQTVHVTAAALSPLARGRAAGRHYSASARFPFVVGVDGVGRLDDGRRVLFLLPRAPYGSMAEQAAVPAAQCLPLPDALDDVTAAAIANPGMSSWMAYAERARLRAGETVLVNGATGTAGRLAVQIARHFGAKKVIAVGRNADALREVAALGAEATITLGVDEAALERWLEEEFAQGVDVVIDYLWGKSAECLLRAAAKAGTRPLRFVQVGAASGGEIGLPGAVLRSAPIELMGSGLGSVPFERIVHAVGQVLQAVVPAGLRIAANPVALAEVERAWHEGDAAGRTVFIVGERSR